MRHEFMEFCSFTVFILKELLKNLHLIDCYFDNAHFLQFLRCCFNAKTRGLLVERILLWKYFEKWRGFFAFHTISDL